jgi:hypothetical protein
MATDEYTSITSDDPRSGLLTYPQLQARRAIAVALATRNRPYPKTIGEGLTALGEGLGEGYLNRNLDVAERAQQARDTAANSRLEGLPATPPAPGGASLEGGPATQSYAMAPPDATAQPSSVVAQAPQTPLLWKQIPEKPDMTVEEFNQRTARNESGGEKDPYRAVGREVNRRGDRAWGKYQVMGENIPVWTKQYFGQELTPQQFLDSKDAQEAVAKGKGGEYLAKYGPNGAAAAWFGGEKGMQDASRPNLQTHIADYVQKFNRPPAEEERSQIAASAAGGQQPIQLASLGGMPTPDTAPDPREAVAQSIAGPPPQQFAQAGPAPLPTAPPAPAVQPRPQIAPSIAATMEETPTPAGPKPNIETYLNDPRIKPMIDEAKRQMGSSALSPSQNERAKARYEELRNIAKDEYTKDWTIWHERTGKEDAFRLEKEKRQRERELHSVTMTEAPYKLEQARKQAEPTVREVDGRIMERDPDSGKWNDVTPGGSLPTLTEAQGKMLGFYQRAKWAMHNLGEGKELTDFWNWHASGMPVIGNYATNARFQRQLQAANELAAVQLRLETGAAAPPAELKNVVDRFVPKPGDQPELHLQKEQQRNALVKSYADQMGSKGQAYVEKFNREFELDKKEYDKKQNALMPPVRITDESQLDLVPPGRRWIAPDGSIRQKR